MSYLDEAKTYTTADYSLVFKKGINPDTVKQLEISKKRYDTFLQGLINLGILDNSKEFDELATFKQGRAGTNSIFYSIESFGDFWESQTRIKKHGYSFLDYDNTKNKLDQTPNFHLLSFNLTSGQIYNLPISFMAKSTPEAVKHVARSEFLFKGKTEFSASHGIDVDLSLQLLECLLDGVMAHLEQFGVNPTRKKAILWLTYSKYINKGFSLMSSKFNLFEEAKKPNPVGLVKLIHEVIEEDLDPFVVFYALSNEVNQETRFSSSPITAMPKFGLTEMRNLSGLPQPYIRDIMLPTEQLSLDFNTFS